MGYEERTTIKVTCEGCDPHTGVRCEEDSYAGRNFRGFKTSFLSKVKERGWKHVQRKGVIDTSLITDDTEEYDFDYYVHKAWFCEHCAASGEIEKWHERIKAERKRREEDE